MLNFGVYPYSGLIPRSLLRPVIPDLRSETCSSELRDPVKDVSGFRFLAASLANSVPE